MGFIFDGITVNCNEYIAWSNSNCGVYTVRNINDAQTPVIISITNALLAFNFSATLAPNQSVGFTLPADGFFKVVVTTTDGPNMPVLRSGYLFETCKTYACMEKLITESFATAKEESCGKCKKTKKPVNKIDVTNKANAVWLNVLLRLIAFQKRFNSLNTSVESDAEILSIDELFGQLRSFVSECCGEKNKNCGCKKVNCGCKS